MHWICDVMASLLKKNVTISHLGFQKSQDQLDLWLLRNPTLVTHHGMEMPDTVVVFVSHSENNLLRAISLTSFIYRHPVCPVVCLVGTEGKKPDGISITLNNNIG